MHAKRDQTAPIKILRRNEALILEAIADRIFPATKTAGAVEAGALDYIDLALRGAYALYLPLYRRGLRAIDRHARRKFGAKFTLLDDEQKDAILIDFEWGAVADWKKAAEFFETIRYHVLEGVFCEPQYGGNKDMIGWRMVDFPGQQSGYPDAYINKRVDLAPVAVDYVESKED
jgi:gluconate 2-dehydrogenase gamma chain